MISVGAGGALLLVMLTVGAVRLLFNAPAAPAEAEVVHFDSNSAPQRPPEPPRRFQFPLPGNSTNAGSADGDRAGSTSGKPSNSSAATASTAANTDETIGKSAVAPPVKWDVQADPVANSFEPSPRRIRIPFSGRGSQITIYPEHTSRFVALGNNFIPTNEREIWDLSTRKQIGRIQAGLGMQRGVLGPNGKWFACLSSTEDQLLLFDVKSGQVAAEIPLEKTRISLTPEIRFAGADRLVVLRYQQPLEVWSIAEGRQERSIPVAPNPEMGSLATSPGGRYAALVVRSSNLRTSEVSVLDLEQGSIAGTVLLEPLTGRNAVNCDGLAFSRDGQFLAGVLRSFSKDFGHRLVGWDVASGEFAFDFELDKDLKKDSFSGSNYSPDVQWFPGGQRMLVYGRFVFDRQAGGPVWRVPEDLETTGETASVFGDDRVLLVGGDNKDRHVMQVKIPVDELAQATKSVAAGGLAIDVDLPPLTAATTDGMVLLQVGKTAVPWQVVPDTPLLPPADFLQSTVRIDALPALIGSVLVSSSATPRAAIALDSTDRNSSVQILDLTEGGQATEFDIPFRAKVLAISRDGSRLLTRVKDSPGRLDVWSIPDGHHIAGWRPHQDEGESRGGIEAAGFVDADHVLTRARNRTIALWEVPSCRCVFALDGKEQSSSKLDYEESRIAREAEQREQKILSRRSAEERATDQPVLNPGLPAISPGGQTVAVWHMNQIYFVQARTGQILGQIPVEGALGAAAFSPSGKEFAATYLCLGGARLIAINLEDGSTLAEIPLDIRGTRMHWCQDNTLLLDNRRLIDLNHGRVVWTYTHNSILHSPDSPDGRHYALVGRLPRLMASTLPHAELATRLKGFVAPPQLLLGKGKQVTLDINLSRTSPALTELSEELQENLTGQLTAHGMQIAPGQSLRLAVKLSVENTGKTAQYKPIGQTSGQSTVSVNEQVIRYSVAFSLAGKELWEWGSSSSNLTAVTARLDPGESLQDKLNERQWNFVKERVKQVKLPGHMFPEEGASGLGTSVLKAGL
ncbi:MAG: hypothetical protein KDA79_09285 [Planctomycetaceae bacterium]|nr:hypothetical protein [Planctomycetaceae bacterium]